MISFTMNVKNEISGYDGNRNENIAELSAIMRNSARILSNEIEVVTENSKVAKRVYLLIKDIYNVNVRIDDRANAFNRNRLFVVVIDNKIDIILNDLAVLDDNNSFIETVPSYLIDSEEEKRAYLKGLFLSCGSVNDPKTSRYHLEFFVNEMEEANFVSNLLNEFMLNSKVIKKDKKYMIYIKEAEKIGDFLRIINASQAVMYYEDIRIYRDHKNMTNRLNNMEQANIEKTIMTCNEQINDINLIIDKLGMEFLDDKTQEVVKYRLKYPECSLQELSEIMSYEIDKPITKSGLNHRFRKIREIANKLRENGDINE